MWGSHPALRHAIPSIWRSFNNKHGDQQLPSRNLRSSRYGYILLELWNHVRTQEWRNTARIRPRLDLYRRLYSCPLLLLGSHLQRYKQPQRFEQLENAANWVGTGSSLGTYTKGSTTIILNGVPNLQNGSLVILDQCNTGLSGNAQSGSGLFSMTGKTPDPAGCSGAPNDNSNLFVCSWVGTCATQGAVGSGRGEGPQGANQSWSGTRGQRQTVKVTSVSSLFSCSAPSGTCYTVGITPGTYASNWNSGQSPGAYWPNDLPATADGVENYSIDCTNMTAQGSSLLSTRRIRG